MNIPVTPIVAAILAAGLLGKAHLGSAWAASSSGSVSVNPSSHGSATSTSTAGNGDFLSITEIGNFPFSVGTAANGNNIASGSTSGTAPTHCSASTTSVTCSPP